MRSLHDHELQSIAGGSLLGDVASFAAKEIGASVLTGTAFATAGFYTGGRYGGEDGGVLGFGLIGQLVGLVAGGVIGGVAGAITGPLVGWEGSEQLAQGVYQGFINGTLL